MFEELLPPKTKKIIAALEAEVEASYLTHTELTNEIIALESKASVRFSRNSQHGALGNGDASELSFYTMLPDSFKTTNRVLIDNALSCKRVFEECSAELVKAKWSALEVISNNAVKQYLEAANILKEKHCILYGLANRESRFKESINHWKHLNIPCNYGILRQENTGQSGAPTISNELSAVKQGTLMSNEIAKFIKPKH